MRKWIHEHVHACASELIYKLARTDYVDDLMEIFIQDDWRTPAEDAGFSVAAVMRDPSGAWVPRTSGEQVFSWLYYRTNEGLEAALQAEDVDSRINQNSERDAWRQAGEDNGLDCVQNEIYEYWIVSQWFAERLIEKGEVVTMDF
ncbi:MAG: hypothetical protein L0177_18625, partial [Chloroflexi bacterium]|nr:hypothetical protein [Chloroflexota bacterium]